MTPSLLSNSLLATFSLLLTTLAFSQNQRSFRNSWIWEFHRNFRLHSIIRTFPSKRRAKFLDNWKFSKQGKKETLLWYQQELCLWTFYELYFLKKRYSSIQWAVVSAINVDLLFPSPVPPSFVKTPANIEVSVRDRQVLFRCLATGNPTPTISWRKNGKPLKPDTRHVMSESGALSIFDPKFDDEGNYECVAENSAGEIVSKAALNYHGVEGTKWYSVSVY